MPVCVLFSNIYIFFFFILLILILITILVYNCQLNDEFYSCCQMILKHHCLFCHVSNWLGERAKQFYSFFTSLLYFKVNSNALHMIHWEKESSRVTFNCVHLTLSRKRRKGVLYIYIYVFFLFLLFFVRSFK